MPASSRDSSAAFSSSLHATESPAKLVRTGERPTMDRSAVVVTLGPSGTDSHAEASKMFHTVLLAETFPEAMSRAHREKLYVLIAAGYVERSVDTGNICHSWVDIHFQWIDKMRMCAVWESPTKEMCLAVNRKRVKRLEDVRTVAIHPSTESLVKEILPDVAYTYTKSKPKAVEYASDGLVDACLGSRDTIQASASLAVHRTLNPTMVWCLYKP